MRISDWSSDVCSSDLGDRETALISRTLIEDDLRAKPADLLLIDVRGDSMMPDFLHGDQKLVDKRDRDPRQPGPLALWDAEGYVVKLVERVPQRTGWYRLFSGNNGYMPYAVEETETTSLRRRVGFAVRLQKENGVRGEWGGGEVG